MFVYVVGCGFGTEKPELRLALNLSVVVAGVLVASWGEQRPLHQLTLVPPSAVV
jgi:hypothetical protein